MGCFDVVIEEERSSMIHFTDRFFKVLQLCTNLTTCLISLSFFACEYKVNMITAP
jgi:hypothetical protein